ncbi:g13301 [Coccomyxa viridis]|uniref:G13301 protein n=1 Tax=Coccomyxa viridis TaxID=1274662 RepID=A0ABP1GCS6_9CHLO
MAAQGAWGGGIWGANAGNSDSVVLKEGEEACTICHVRRLEIALLPCKHQFCSECVTCLRKANVFKADAGIRCPLCRTFAEGFAPLKAGVLDEGLVEANRAARAAAAARLPVSRQTRQKDVQGPADLEAMSKWTCKGCGESHYHTFVKCAKCNTYRPHDSDPSFRKQDVLKCSEKEIRILAEQKFYPGLRQAFDEAGIHPTEDGPCIGTPETVIAAVKKRGSPERLHHVIRMLTMHGHVTPLVTEYFGNYTLQDLLGATQAFRLAAAKLRAEGKTSPQALEKLVGLRDGTDALGHLAIGITQAMPEGAMHSQGNFVVLKLLEVADPMDCMPLAGVLLPQAILITSKKQFHGLQIMLKLVFKIGQLASTVSHMRGGAQQVLDSFCGLYIKEPRQVMWRAHHQLGGQMLVEAAFVALPQANGVELLCQIARLGLSLLNSEHGGISTLLCMASCESTDEAVTESITTAMCILAKELENDFAKAMARYRTGPFPADGAELIWKMAQILEKGGETEWVKTIVTEVVNGIEELQHHKHAMDKIPLLVSMEKIPTQMTQLLMQKIRGFIPEDRFKQMQSIVAQRRRQFAKQQHQAAEGPHTPQQSPPQTQVLRFGNFDQQDVAGGSASQAQAPPVHFSQPPSSLGPRPGSAPGQPRAGQQQQQGPAATHPQQQQPAHPPNAPHPPQQRPASAPGPQHPGPPPPPPPSQQQQPRPPQLVTPHAPRPASGPPGLPPPPALAPHRLSPRVGPPPGARPVMARRPVYQPGGPAQPTSQGQAPVLAALMPHLMIGSQAPAQKPAAPPMNGMQDHPAASQASQGAPPPAQPAQAAQRPAQTIAALPPPRVHPAATPNGVSQVGASSQQAPSVRAPAATTQRQPSGYGNGIAPATQPPVAQQARPNSRANGQTANAAPMNTESWMCKMCTYNHEGPEANYLLCAVCESQRQD